MENDIFMYVAGYAGVRLAVLAAFAYAFYLVLRPKPALAKIRRSDHVPDDHC